MFYKKFLKSCHTRLIKLKNPKKPLKENYFLQRFYLFDDINATLLIRTVYLIRNSVSLSKKCALLRSNAKSIVSPATTLKRESILATKSWSFTLE